MVDVLKNQFFKAFIRIDTTDFVRVFSWVVAFLNVCRWAEEAGKYGLIDPYQCSRNYMEYDLWLYLSILSFMICQTNKTETVK